MASCMCNDCEDLFDTDNVSMVNQFRVASDLWGTCPDCVKSESDGLIRTVARLDKTGRYAWPGGYALVFYPPDGGVTLCFDCAKETLQNDDGPLDYNVEDGDQQFYGGTYCDACSAVIVESCCPECGDELADKPRLFADNVDAAELCQRCAAKMVIQALDDAASDEEMAACLPDYHDSYYRNVATNPRAKRIPGVGIELIDSQYGSAWYARPGTIYRYPNAYGR